MIGSMSTFDRSVVGRCCGVFGVVFGVCVVLSMCDVHFRKKKRDRINE